MDSPLFASKNASDFNINTTATVYSTSQEPHHVQEFGVSVLPVVHQLLPAIVWTLHLLQITKSSIFKTLLRGGSESLNNKISFISDKFTFLNSIIERFCLARLEL